MEPDYVKLKDIKPVLAGYIRDAQILLRRAPVPDDEAIHDVRVFMKKSRSALKLVASQLDRENVTRDIVALREVGRKICSVRESFVLRKTLKEFKKEFPGIFSRFAEIEKINLILKKPEIYSEPSDDLKSVMEEINQLLTKAGFRIRFHSMNNIDPRLLLKELELTYIKVV